MGKVVETAAKSLTNVLSGMAAAAGPPVLALRGGGDAPARVEYHRFDDKFGMRVFSRASDATQVENAVLYKTNEVVSDSMRDLADEKTVLVTYKKREAKEDQMVTNKVAELFPNAKMQTWSPDAQGPTHQLQ
mmetsp:Transcript_43708/g.68435  ORF Transcript_43708/g.68435 Transcript_43708/m.68435 type:complete len:132 (-) Transcript_43708:933-1328(-)